MSYVSLKPNPLKFIFNCPFCYSFQKIIKFALKIVNELVSIIYHDLILRSSNTHSHIDHYLFAKFGMDILKKVILKTVR